MADSGGSIGARLRLLLADRDFTAGDYEQLLALDQNNVVGGNTAPPATQAVASSRGRTYAASLACSSAACRHSLRRRRPPGPSSTGPPELIQTRPPRACQVPSHRVACEADLRRLPTHKLTEADVARGKVRGWGGHRLGWSRSAAGNDDDHDDDDEHRPLARSYVHTGTLTPTSTPTKYRGPWHQLMEVDTTSCPVCLEPYCVGEHLRTLPCLHRMHT